MLRPEVLDCVDQNWIARRPALGAPVFGTVYRSDLCFRIVRFIGNERYGILDSYIATVKKSKVKGISSSVMIEKHPTGDVPIIP